MTSHLRSGGTIGDGRELLGSFLPLSLLDRLYGLRGDRPNAVEFPAAVIFVDVSRYTNLVEQLVRRGQEGLERIPSLLNQSYARCVEQVGNSGGEITCLIGDAMLAYWPADDSDLGDAVQRAVNCAEAICRDRGDGLDNAADAVAPPLHVGVGAGTLWSAAIGAGHHWNLFVGGDAVLQAAKSQALANRWQYELSDSAKAALLGRSYSGPSVRQRGSAGQPTVDWLLEFLPSHIRDIISGPEHGRLTVPSQVNPIVPTAARLDEIAETRPVTAVFARITGLDYRGPDALLRHQSLYEALQRNLISRGGPPGELRFDDKGLIFVAVFGELGSFHRDDPMRAIDAARAICPLVEGLGLKASVGLATGDALIRVVGSMRRRQLMVLGAPMNRAARLMTADQEGVLCDSPTERAARSSFSFEQRGTLHLEGLGDMAAVFRPMERRPTAITVARPIGRQRELEFLIGAYDEVRGGDKRIVVVMGESGIGKSTLANAFVGHLISIAAPVCVAQAERDDRRTFLLPWQRVLASLLNLPAESDGSAVFGRVAATTRDNPDLAGRLPLLASALGVHVEQTERTRHLDGAHRADATMRLVGDLIGALAPQPCVFVLEDAQWLDSASWRLVEWVIASQSSLLMVLCARAEEVPEELRDLLRRAAAARGNAWLEAEDSARFCRILNLEQLDEPAIYELVAQTLGGAPPQREFANRVTSLAGGNPLFAEEIVLTLKTKGLIAVRDGFWRPIRPIESLQYFEGVERVVRERLDRLETTTADVIKAAAVIGRSFTCAALEALIEGKMGGSAVEETLELLRAAHFVRKTEDSREYQFRHDQIRDVVYNSIPLDVRQRLHGKLADWMEASQTADPAPDLAILVQHFEASGNKEKVVRYANLAATNALKIGAFREAAAFLEICLSHEAREPPWTLERAVLAVRWRRELAEAHYGRGDIRAQGVAIRHALTYAGYPVPRSQRALFARLLGLGLKLALNQLSPPSWLWIKRDDVLLWEREVARSLSQAAVVDYFELRFTQGMCNLIAAVRHAERTGLTTEMAVASAQLACGLGIFGQRRACMYFMTRAERTAITLNDPAAHAYICNLDALWRIGSCDWPSVDRRVDQCQELCVISGDQLRWCNAQAVRFWSLYYRGNRGSVLETTAQELLSRAQNSSNIQQEIWALRHKALCVLDTDNPREAVDILQLITDAMQESADIAERVCTQGMLALALARIGQHGSSVRAAVEALHLLRDMKRPTGHVTLVGISGVCEVLLRGREAGLSQQYDEWDLWEGQALRQLRRYSHVFPIGGPQYGLWAGVSHWLNGRKSLAVSTWRRSLSRAEQLSLRQDGSLIAAEMRRRLD